MALAALPRRDGASRAHLEDVGRRSQVFVLARERAVPLGGELQQLVPGGALTRGSVVRVDGGGATSVAYELAAAVTSLGEWVTAVDLEGTLGALAAREAGVALDRFAVARRVPPARWATVIAALLDGTSLVLAEVPRGINAGDARRLTARARERGSILLVCSPPERWQAGTALTFVAENHAWDGPEEVGFLTRRALVVRVEGHGAATRPRVGELARAV